MKLREFEIDNDFESMKNWVIVGVEPESRAADVGEILREGLLALLLGCLDVISCRADSDIILQGRVLNLLQCICLCKCFVRTQRYRDTEQHTKR